MIFSSLTFIFYFLPLFFLAYFASNKKNSILLIFSLFFYYWGDQNMVFIMLLSAFIDFFCGKQIDLVIDSSPKEAKFFLIISIVTNISLLFYFKYFNFFIEELSSLSLYIFKAPLNPFTEKVILPLGISFYTFQSMTYSIDIYNKKVKPTKSLVDFLTYVTMFPQLIAGPIVTFKEIQHDLTCKKISLEDLELGLQRFILGFSKKVLIANNIQPIVEFYFQGFNHNFYESWIAGISFLILIYFDFSAYSDMAIGLGRMLGFKFPENFNTPYSSLSVQEFWSRWHMTLSNWLKNYIYIPLGGGHKGEVRAYTNILFVFLACGVWHGAAWTFIIWGLYHGILVSIERAFLKQKLKSCSLFLQHFYLVLVTLIGFIFFRSQDLPQALNIIKNLFAINHIFSLNLLFEKVFIYNFVWLIVGILLCFPLNNYFKTLPSDRFKRLLYLCLFIFSLMELIATDYQPFIYFRF